MRTPRRLLLLAVLVAVVVAGVLVVRSRQGDGSCGAERVANPRNPLHDAALLKAEPDPGLDRLTAAVGAMGPPFGPVLAGIGFNYDQFLQLYGVAGGVLAWTKNNAPVTMLDQASLAPRWSLRPTSKRTAWDASDDRFLLLDLDEKKPTEIASYRLDDGARQWCTELADPHRAGEPVATAFLADGNLLTALPSGDGIAVSRLDGGNGQQRWRQVMTGIDRADFLGTLSDGVALAGGTEEYRFADPRPTTATTSLTAFRVDDASTVWTWGPGAGALAHVVGVDGGRVIVEVGTASGVELRSLDAADGTERWRVKVSGLQATLRGDVVLTKSTTGLTAYDAATGAVRWRLPVPTDRSYFPYGFTLGQMPSLDADHVLVPTTEALRILDLRTGRLVSYRLPLDGVRTTYWPYQLLVTDTLLGVVTNTGGVVARRAGGVPAPAG